MSAAHHGRSRWDGHGPELIDVGPGGRDAWAMELPAVSTVARWAADVRGEGRAVRVAAHVDAGFLVLSTWKADVCVGTVRLVPREAAELIAGLAECLAGLACEPPGPTSMISDLRRPHLDDLGR